MSSISIRPATYADAQAVAQVHYDALDQFHDFYAAFFKVHPRDSLRRGTELALKLPVLKVLVAVEEGEVVGFVKYKIVMAGAEEEEASEEEVARREEVKTLFAAKEHMTEMWDKFNEREEEMDAVYEEAMKKQKHISFNHLMVSPSHQRKGIGRKLVSAVLAGADEEGLPAMIAASAESHALYLSLGFEDLGKWTMDNGHWANEIVRHEKELGVDGGNEGLAEKFEGTREQEWVMVRWAKKG